MKTAINNFGRLYAILDGCTQLLTVVCKSRNLQTSLQNYPTF